MIDAKQYTRAARADRPTKTVSVTLDPDLAARLERARDIDGFLASEFIRDQLDAVLTELEKDRPGS